MSRLYIARVQREAIQAYGGACACCGVTERRFLAIDHVGGYIEEDSPRSGYAFWLWLRRQNYPAGYRVLCHNCNHAIRFGEDCPHLLARKELQSA